MWVCANSDLAHKKRLGLQGWATLFTSPGLLTCARVEARSQFLD